VVHRVFSHTATRVSDGKDAAGAITVVINDRHVCVGIGRRLEIVEGWRTPGNTSGKYETEY